MAELTLQGIRYRVHPDVYDPAEDTELLLDSMRIQPGERILDLGCGTGLLGIAAALRGARVLGADRNPSAVRLARDNARLNGVEIEPLTCDLLAPIRAGRFDAILFNPPYLPTEPHERLSEPLNWAFDAGPSGRGLLERFLDAIQRDPCRRVLTLASSLQGEDAVPRGARLRGFRARALRSKQLRFETLTVYELSAG